MSATGIANRRMYFGQSRVGTVDPVNNLALNQSVAGKDGQWTMLTSIFIPSCGG